jgi:hypothetical protein
MSICDDLIDSADKDGTAVNRITTGVETWCFLYDTTTWESPSSPRQKKPRQDGSKGKVMLELFFGSSGIVHMEFIPKGATLNKHHYMEILRCLRSSVRRKRPEFHRRKNWLLLHDDVPAHRSVLVQEKLAKQQVTVSPCPPHSPDLAPCDFFFLPRLKGKLPGRRFESAEDIVTATSDFRFLRENIYKVKVKLPL